MPWQMCASFGAAIPMLVYGIMCELDFSVEACAIAALMLICGMPVIYASQEWRSIHYTPLSIVRRGWPRRHWSVFARHMQSAC